MKITVLEYLCCGGLVGFFSANDPEESTHTQMSALINEGLEMWRAIVLDLLACGHHVTSVVDPRVMETLYDGNNVPRDEALRLVEFDSTISLEDNWIRTTLGSDRVLVVAPEIDGILSNLVARLRVHRCVVIAPSPHFVKVTSDKWETFRSLGEHIPQPRTWLASDLDEVDSLDRSSECGYALKPRDGAGGGGCLKLESWSQVKEVVTSLESPENWIIQEWQSGKPCSVALLVDEAGKLSVLGSSEQILRFDNDGFHYLGARGPIANQATSDMESWCQQVVALIPGAFGWIGIDYVAGDSSAEADSGEDNNGDNGENVQSGSPHKSRTLIEINPRLTTSYLLYRQVYGPELSQGVIGLQRDWSTLKLSGQDKVLEYIVDSASIRPSPQSSLDDDARA